ncbi:trypsin-like peptidase domain-containing protein, partial [Achromobacter dolens]|uniref:trypsin-like peptidase domain-containing protein n=1 Tax=Achromobacter dolens TaxID=1287738 RepID=UPI0031D774ED
MKTSKMNPSRLVLALLAAGAIGGAGATAAFGGISMAASAPSAVAATAAPGASTPGAPMGAPNFAQITRDYGPAVVNISISGTRKVSDDDDDDDPFAQFFGQIPGARGGMPSREVPIRGEGSGFIVSSDGVILTNAHVVQGAKEVTVKLTDRREFRAKVLGADPQTDVAVIKIDAKNLPVVKVGDVNQLQVGEWVLAIGSP